MGGIVAAAGRSLWNSVCDGLYLITRGGHSSGRILLPGLSLLPWTLKKRQKTNNNRRFYFPPWAGWSLPKPALFPGGPGRWACGALTGQPRPGGSSLRVSVEWSSPQSGWHQARLFRRHGHGLPSVFMPSRPAWHRLRETHLPISQNAGLAEAGAGQANVAKMAQKPECFRTGA